MKTLKELSEIAGVSVSTISKALNDSNDIAEATKLRLVNLAKNYGYVKPSKKTEAKSKSKNSPVIAVIYSDITNNYYSRLMEIFDSYISKMNGLLMMSSAGFETNRIIQLCRFYESIPQVDGIICVSPYNIFGDIPPSKLPMVVLSYPSIETYPFDIICVDEGVGIDEAISCFKTYGHKKIAFLSEKISHHRLQFFKDSMKKHGLSVDPAFIKASDKRFEQAGFEAMKELIEQGNLPTAVFASLDDIALGAAKAISEEGLSIPEDISIAGVNNTKCMLNGHIMLSSVNCHMEEQVDIAISLLMKKVKEPNFKVFQNVNLHTNFAERNSIGDAKL